MNSCIPKLAMISNQRTAALLSDRGEIVWLCWPAFDSDACFAMLIGSDDNGVWSLAPKHAYSTKRSYMPDTMTLESVYDVRFGGTVAVADFMPMSGARTSLVRIVRGTAGAAKMQMRFAPRFDYGNTRPLFEQGKGGEWTAVSGPHRLTLRTSVSLKLEDGALLAEWRVSKGDCASFVLEYSRSYGESTPEAFDQFAAKAETEEGWRNWIGQSIYRGPYQEAVNRSLLTLKSLTDMESGGFVAAPSSSLPEKVGGVRNWDYRYCWLRDTTFSLLGLVHCGLHEDAKVWLQWLSRCLQGDPKELKVVYGISGRREHSEWTADWLSGYENSRPVHFGNKASSQLQLDTFGEVMDALLRARRHHLYPIQDKSGQGLEVPLLRHLETVWDQPDRGLWEMRSGNRQFTQSKVMAWVAFDRGVRAAEQFGIDGPVDRWRRVRDKIHKTVCSQGFNRGLNSFTQSFNNKLMDASLLLLPLVGFLPIDDPRIVGTVKMVEKRLLRNGLLLRYNSAKVDDGFPAGEGAFLACNFWLVEVYVLQGRHEEARVHFEKLLKLRNDLGLLSEEYDHKHGLIGNMPQAFSHIGLINAALSLQAGTSIRHKDLNS